MRHLLALILVVAAVSTAKAQDSKILAGAGLTYATEIENIGINLKGVYLINDVWEAEAGFTYFFEKNYTNWSALDFNGHYVFYNTDGKCVYALAGLNFTFYKFDMGDAVADPYEDYYDEMEGYPGYNPLSDFEAKGTETGLNLGIGGRMPISDVLLLNGDIKYTVGGADYLSINAGILYKF